MPNNIAETFIEALGQLEAQRDVEPIAQLYAEQADVGNVLVPEKFHGPEGARDFWQKYRETFGEVRSTFRNQIVTEGRAALEWTTEGTTSNGQPFRYDGVSVIEADNGKITRFRAYFDPHQLGEQVQPSH